MNVPFKDEFGQSIDGRVKTVPFGIAYIIKKPSMYFHKDIINLVLCVSKEFIIEEGVGKSWLVYCPEDFLR